MLVPGVTMESRASVWGLIPAADWDVVCGAGVLDLGLLRSWFRCRILVSGFGSTKPAIYALTALFEFCRDQTMRRSRRH
jgi:hypothetical protein